jgi:hypothetical protein
MQRHVMLDPVLLLLSKNVEHELLFVECSSELSNC